MVLEQVCVQRKRTGGGEEDPTQTLGKIKSKKIWHQGNRHGLWNEMGCKCFAVGA